MCIVVRIASGQVAAKNSAIFDTNRKLASSWRGKLIDNCLSNNPFKNYASCYCSVVFRFPHQHSNVKIFILRIHQSIHMGFFNLKKGNKIIFQSDVSFVLQDFNRIVRLQNNSQENLPIFYVPHMERDFCSV